MPFGLRRLHLHHAPADAVNRHLGASAVDRPREQIRNLRAFEAELERRSEIDTLWDRYRSLSYREREVMSLVVAGLLNKQISFELEISEFTVKAHRGKVMRKMVAVATHLMQTEEDYDPGDPMRALGVIHEGRETGRFLTGILYLNPAKASLDRELALVDEPLATLPLERVRPPRAALEEIMAGLKIGKG